MPPTTTDLMQRAREAAMADATVMLVFEQMCRELWLVPLDVQTESTWIH